MTNVKVWRLRGGVDRERAIQSVLKCADDSTFPNYNTPDRLADASDFVRELVRQADRCASSANASPSGLKLTVMNPLSNDDRIEFRDCFYYSVLAEDEEEPKIQLKLFRVSVIQPSKSSSRATVQNHTLLILACTKAEAFVVASNHDPRYRKWDIELSEIEGPFTNGQIIMDFGLRTISTLTDILIDF